MPNFATKKFDMDSNSYIKKETINPFGLPAIKYLPADGSRKFCFDMASLEDAIQFYNDALQSVHAHSFFEIIYIIEGEGKHLIDYDDYEISGHTVFFLSPSQFHQLKKIRGAKGYVIVFTEQLLAYFDQPTLQLIKDVFFNYYAKVTICKVRQSEEKKIEKFLGDLRYIINNLRESPQFVDYAVHQISILLLGFKDYCVFQDRKDIELNSPDYRYYRQFAEYVESNFKKVHTAKACADVLGISWSSLNRATAKYVGKSPYEILNGRIILEAKRLLRYGKDMSIKDIAAVLGFPDSSNFLKFFKRETGFTPSDFRKMAWQ